MTRPAKAEGSDAPFEITEETTLGELRAWQKTQGMALRIRLNHGSAFATERGVEVEVLRDMHPLGDLLSARRSHGSTISEALRSLAEKTRGPR